MEKTLDTVLRSIGNPSITSITSGIMSRSPSPTSQTAKTQALIDNPSPPPRSASTVHSLQSHHGTTSPRLHSLPDNELNPLGLLAEASLANRRAQSSQAQTKPTSVASDPKQHIGVASDLYFKPGIKEYSPLNCLFPLCSHIPGVMSILPLRRLYIERQVQPEMLTFVSTEEVIALFKMYSQIDFLPLDDLDLPCPPPPPNK